MAKVNRNVVIDGAQGRLGRQLLLKRDKAGRTILSAKPVFDPDRVFTPAQQAQQLAFRQAVAYALSMRDNPLYARLAAGTPRTPRNIAIADWFHPPEILELDLDRYTGHAGQLIRVKAVDNVRVETLTLSISAADGTPLEQGPATRVDGLYWEYLTTASAAGSRPLRVLACAQDLPGHTTRLEKEKP
jgi:hypothetical protein